MSDRAVPSPGASYTLRPATPSDYGAFYRIHKESMGPYIEATWGPWVELAQRDFFQARMDRGHIEVVVVEGVAGGILELDDRFGVCFVSNIQLSAACRRRGIGSAILREVLAQAGARGQAVELTVLRVNPARALYERLGFVETSVSATHHFMRWSPPGT